MPEYIVNDMAYFIYLPELSLLPRDSIESLTSSGVYSASETEIQTVDGVLHTIFHNNVFVPCSWFQVN